MKWRYGTIEKKFKIFKYLFIAILAIGALTLIIIEIISNADKTDQDIQTSSTIYYSEEYKKTIEIDAIGTDVVPHTYSILPLRINDDQSDTDEDIIEFTDKEIDIIARVVMSESSIESYAVKVAVAKTVINRVRSDHDEFIILESVSDVVVPGQFSTTYNGDTTEECYNAVYDAISDTELPDDMYWFRNDYITYGYEYVVDTDSILKFSTMTNHN